MILSFTQDQTMFKGLSPVMDYHVSGYHQVPMPDYDKTYYYFDEKARQIVACRILKVVIGSMNSGTCNFFLIKTPNGLREVEQNKYNFYASAADCQMSMSGQACACSFETFNLKKLFPEHIVCYTNTWFSPRHCCFAFKDGRVQEVTTYIRYMTFDRYGCSICFVNEEDRHGKVYLDKDECLRENTAGISVVEFEDEKKPEPEPLMDASNNHDADLVDKINIAWQSKRHEFIDIVRLLVKRDVWDENPEFFEQSVEDQCRVYCQNIADDKDLSVILDYCRV